MSKFFAATFFFFLINGSALAWDAVVDGPDVFGKTKVVASEGAYNNGLVIQCNSDSELFFAFIQKKKEFDKTPEAPAKLLVKASEASPVSFDATVRDWNDNYIGVVVAGRADDLVKVLDLIGSAKGKIEVGYDVGGVQESASFGSHNSTRTIQTVFDKFKLTRPDK